MARVLELNEQSVLTSFPIRFGLNCNSSTLHNYFAVDFSIALFHYFPGITPKYNQKGLHNGEMKI